MQKFKTVTRTVEEQIVDEVICNLCGKTLAFVLDGYDPDCVQIRKTWGFSSGKDMTQQSADICEPCWDALCEKMKVQVTESHWMDPIAPIDDEDLLPDCTATKHQPHCRHYVKEDR